MRKLCNWSRREILRDETSRLGLKIVNFKDCRSPTSTSTVESVPLLAPKMLGPPNKHDSCAPQFAGPPVCIGIADDLSADLGRVVQALRGTRKITYDSPAIIRWNAAFPSDRCKLIVAGRERVLHAVIANCQLPIANCQIDRYCQTCPYYRE